MICIFSIAKINVQNYNSVVILSNTHIKKKIHFTLGISSKKKTLLSYLLLNQIKITTLVIENSIPVIFNIDSHIIQLYHNLQCQGMDPNM